MSEPLVDLASSRPLGNGPRQPRYRSIAAELIRGIEAQEYPPGSLLPSEVELATEFGVTRMTVRQALSGLAAQGIIERRHGHGTVVVPIKLQRQANRPMGLAEELKARGLSPGSHTLKFIEARPPKDVGAALWVGPRGNVFCLRRQRFADGVLIGVQESFIPTKYAPDLLDVDFEDQSLTSILRDRYALAAAYADLTIEAIAADRTVAADIEVDLGAPVLKTSRVSFLEDRRPLEKTVGWFLSTRYSYVFRQGLSSSV
jgi:GntR family transcriptional regulator